MDYFAKLKKNVIDAGICTHCGTCIGLFPKKILFRETPRGPLPFLINKKDMITSRKLCDFCPGFGIKYFPLNKFVFHKNPESFLTGNYEKAYIGYSKDAKIRRAGASGGIITSVLIYLLENRMIDGAVVIKNGTPKPWLARPVIATTKEEILSCSQSVYIPVMTNSILSEIKNFRGKLAYVGLPDQVAEIRNLQKKKDNSALKIKYVLGPYVGTSMYLGAIKSFLRSNGINSIDNVKLIRYRDGEWPGYLRIDTKDGKTLKSPKFYYNYLIPFYVTTSSLLSVDFTNELTDISVGDAWNPKYEKKGEGFSVILARTKKGYNILNDMKKKGRVCLDEESFSNVVNMHGHMIDFKKRGAFIRMKIRSIFGRRYPKYDYRPKIIPFSRVLAEIFISSVFLIGRMAISRKIIEIAPKAAVGRLFDFFRKSWKNISRSTKRKGLQNIEFEGS